MWTECCWLLSCLLSCILTRLTVRLRITHGLTAACMRAGYRMLPYRLYVAQQYKVQCFEAGPNVLSHPVTQTRFIVRAQEVYTTPARYFFLLV
jgi:hypothetical protein